ncbi:MAG: elongation factor P maturation arginine rhamnosyltransferase EarP [Fusobacteria bacterium]|nr:elongation factor P maturation arginine rhamnosyltransferase EarP [Fusobacteriota bacterium]
MKKIDIFCEIIDNFGDIGVVYRLAKDLITKNYTVRILINGFNELSMINKKIDNSKNIQIIEKITYINMDKLSIDEIRNIETSDIIIEAFATYPNENYMNNIKNKKTLVLNLEYLSAERWVEDYHLVESLTGTENIKKYFFMQGFTNKTGGIVLGYEFLSKKNDNSISQKRDELVKKSINITQEINFNNKKIISIFTYEYNFSSLIMSLNNIKQNFILLLFGEKTKKSFEINLAIHERVDYFMDKNIEYIFLPFYDQNDFDIFMLTSNLNIVRGEESFIRALLSEKPFIWHSYLQEKNLHMEKVDAFLEFYKDYFKNDDEYKIVLEIFHEFNNRLENKYNINTKYDVFFKYLSLLFEKNTIYPNINKYLLENCDLADNLDKFINKQINLI